MDREPLGNLYNLLPVVYRIRDAEHGYPLKAFLRIIASQVKILKEDIDRLWDNFFIETCDDWVVPYLGDLVGNKPLHEIVHSNRVDVAKTIYYRRRKGTLPMLEELARDVTGWSCHAVEFYQLLGWTQHINHLRVFNKDCPDIRDLDMMDLVNSAFDSVSHTIDLRGIDRTEGWYNIRNLGFFLWRLQNYPLENVEAKNADKKGCYHFSPLGNPTPLFHFPKHEGDEAGLAGEIHIPAPIRPVAFHFDLERCRRDVIEGRTPKSNYYGKDHSLFIEKDGKKLRPESIFCMDLKEWRQPPAMLKYVDAEGKEMEIKIGAGVDVCLGRIVFPAGEAPKKGVEVYYNYGFSANADISGGPYDRQSTLIDPKSADLYIKVEKGSDYATIQSALENDKWGKNGSKHCIIQIQDNAIYGGDLDVELPEDGVLVIEAADRKRPCLRLFGNMNIIAPAGGATLILNGLLIEGCIVLEGGSKKDGSSEHKCNLNMEIKHCTLVPGRELNENGDPESPGLASLKVTDEAKRRENTDFSDLEVHIMNSIVGPLCLPSSSKQLTIRNSIVDAPDVKGKLGIAITGDDEGREAGPPTVLERATIFGTAHFRELTLATDVVFAEEVTVDRTQKGCVRFSSVPIGSKTPRLYRCQPNMSIVKKSKELGRPLSENEVSFIKSRVKPCFTSFHYGHPAYGQLSYLCSEEIRTGAEDGSEMGVFNKLKQPQREANLRIRLEEYLPFGLKPGFIYVT